MNKLNFFQKRDFGENVSFTFQFVKENFIHFFVNILILSIPIIIFNSLIFYVIINNIDRISLFLGIKGKDSFMSILTYIFSLIIYIFSSPSAFLSSIIYFIAFMVVTYIIASLYTTFSYAIVYNYYILHIEKDGKNFNTYELLIRAIKSIKKLLIANILLLGLGFIGIVLFFLFTAIFGKIGVFLILPFSIIIIIYGIRICFYPIIILQEKSSIWKAIQKSIFLIKDHWWETFGLFFVFGVIVSLINWLLEQIFNLFGVNIKTMNWENNTIIAIVVYMIYNLLVSVLANLFSTTVVLAQYGSLVEEKEGVHLKQNIDKLGTISDAEKEEEDF